MTVRQELQTLADRMAALVAQLEKDIEALPDNPRIHRINDKCFAMRASDFLASPAWSAEYHDFKHQYRQVVASLKGIDATQALKRVQEAINQGRVWIKGYGFTRLHPDVVQHLKTLLG